VTHREKRIPAASEAPRLAGPAGAGPATCRRRHRDWTAVVLAIVADAITPTIAAAFLWPEGRPLIWRQVAIAFRGLVVVFVAECRLVGGGLRRKLAALGAVPPRRAAMRIALLAALDLVLAPPILAATSGAPWACCPDAARFFSASAWSMSSPNRRSTAAFSSATCAERTPSGPPRPSPAPHSPPSTSISSL